jgi:hypothetical protein
MDKKVHEQFIDEINKLNDKTDEQVLSEFNKIVKQAFKISGGNLNKLPLIINRAKKLVMIKATSGALKTVREVRIKSREFAKVKIGSI